MKPDEPGWLKLKPQSGETLRKALRRTLVESITSGALRPGVSLPASRLLAPQLGVSRGVVSDAYQQLAAEGYLILRSRVTPVVAPLAAATSPSRSGSARRPVLYDMTPTSPDASLFPLRRWLAAYDQAVRRAPAAALDYRPPQGEESLRSALADRLGRTRGVVAEPSNIVIVQGTAQAMDLLMRVMRGRNFARIGVEDPSHATQHQRIRAHALELVAHPVDRHGVVIDAMDCDAVLVTPAHQFPTGVVLSDARRRQLVEWAAFRDALIIEDDYDAEFRYDREPVRAIQGLAPDRVAYVGTVSKTLAPALRLGWIVAPGSWIDELATTKRLADDFTPALDQLALQLFFKSGEYDRHLRRARAVYAVRRSRLVTTLGERLPELAVEGIAAGVHLVLPLPAGADDKAIASEARDAGVVFQTLSDFSIRSRRPGLVIGYGRLHESAIDGAVDAIRSVVARHL